MLLALLLSVLPWVWYGGACCRRTQEESVQTLGGVDRPCVALTFDDGPKASTTPALLEGLSKRGVHATFFLIGDSIEGNELLVQRMAGEGHQIGVHSQTHRMLTGLSAGEFSWEVDTVRRTLTSLVGRENFMLRPPYGMTDSNVCRWADMPIILWAVDPEDWSDRNTARQVETIVSRVKDGDIILLHDIYPASVDTALQVVDLLLKQGYYFVTVEELFAIRGEEPRAGRIYRSLS